MEQLITADAPLWNGMVRPPGVPEANGAEAQEKEDGKGTAAREALERDLNRGVHAPMLLGFVLELPRR